MKHALLATSIVVVAAIAASTAPAATTSSAPPCLPKVTTIQGHKAAVNCGPATVTLHISGKTYVFRSGFCRQSKETNLELNMGTTVIGAKNNLGKSNFTLVIAHVRTTGAVFSAYSGGKEILKAESVVDVRGNVPAKGTFTSKITIGPKFTGSWDCHGVVWKTP